MRLSELIEQRESERKRNVLRYFWGDSPDSEENLRVLDEDRRLGYELDRLQHEMLTLGDREVAEMSAK